MSRWRGEFPKNNKEKLIARGLGRCYGDASLADSILSTVDYRLFLDFNQDEGIVTCQSGVSLKDILELVVPKGWFLPVTPGTKYVSVGGALASDVHGKNHHVEGCFGDHVLSFDIFTGDGTRVHCTRETYPDLFEATRGGMGLTGIIDTVTLKLKKIETSFIRQEQIKAANLDEIIDLFHKHKDSTYSMAWIDCLKGGTGFGRSIFMKGEHAALEELDSTQKRSPLVCHKKKLLNMPVNLPGFVLNSLTVKAFNWLYYHKNLKSHIQNIVHYDGFFYPLDSIENWNRMYGKRGFVQYQFVLPLAHSKEGLVKILQKIREKGWGSFLAVLKLFGKQDNLISFPMEGFTLALDFPVRKGLFEFLDELDEIVIDLGGRLYLSKDARMEKDIFWKGYPHVDEFIEIVRKYNRDSTISSRLSERLEIA
jgi:FAD/FMN-containing dehydrogenase